jgi:hypothetical protein
VIYEADGRLLTAKLIQILLREAARPTNLPREKWGPHALGHNADSRIMPTSLLLASM